MEFLPSLYSVALWLQHKCWWQFLIFQGFFLGVISWKGASLFYGKGVFYSWGGGGFIFKWVEAPWGALVLMRGFWKKLKDGRGAPHAPTTMGNPAGDAGPWLFKMSDLSGCWQMDSYYIYNKYFVNKLTTLSLYQKSFINSSIVDKIKRIYYNYYYKIVIGSQRTLNKC